MKKSKIFILALGIGLCTSALAQEQLGEVSVCIKPSAAAPTAPGAAAAAPKVFKVTVVGDQQAAPQQWELAPGAAAPGQLIFKVSAPKSIEIVDMNNLGGFTCKADLGGFARSVEVRLNAPGESPSCTVTSSSAKQGC